MTSEMTNYPKGWIVIWQKFKKFSFEIDVDYLKTKDLLAVHSIAIFFFCPSLCENNSDLLSYDKQKQHYQVTSTYLLDVLVCFL